MERKEILVAVLIGILLVTTAIQTIQLVGLSKAEVIVPTTGMTTTSTSGSRDSGGSQPTPANLQNLPSMVGGC